MYVLWYRHRNRHRNRNKNRKRNSNTYYVYKRAQIQTDGTCLSVCGLGFQKRKVKAQEDLLFVLFFFPFLFRSFAFFLFSLLFSSLLLFSYVHKFSVLFAPNNLASPRQSKTLSSSRRSSCRGAMTRCPSFLSFFSLRAFS